VQHLATGSCAYGLATDGVDIFFIDIAGGGVLFRAPADGGATTIVTGSDSHPPTTVDSLALDASNVYYGGADGLYRISRNGGVPERLAAGAVNAVAVDDACVYWGDDTAKAVFALRK
jgi:hypothetical protein